ncbi:MAG TPA: pyrroline-5-carboxylate reductase [Caulobacteraceae bacterium]|nr:pyrroline-5-carboxylate reductase [Caulobacteraceae bacterium]
MTPILLLGAGRMGGALMAGWRLAGAFSGADLIIREPSPGVDVLEAEADGALLNPAVGELRRAKTVVMAVKPQVWRDAAREVADKLAPDAVIVSIAAGVGTAALAEAFGGRRVARVMPTTGAAIGQGTASVFAADEAARERAWALFEPVGAVVSIADEALMHAATAVSGSSPAYLYAFIEALEAAGAKAGLPADDARTLARSTIIGAAALLRESGEDPAELRRQVTSPGGTTQAALEVLLGPGGFPELLERAVTAAVDRSKALG